MSDPKQLDRIADPALLARIFRTFGEPDLPDDEPENSDEPPPRTALDEKLDEAIDRSLLARLERRRTDDWPRTREPVAIRIAIERELAMVIDVDAALATEDPFGEAAEYSRPRWIDEALLEQTPQAVLRDLHRPVRDVGPIELEWIELSDDTRAMAREAYAEAAAELRAVRSMHAISLGWVSGQAGLAEISEILNRPWEESKPANPSPADPRVGHMLAQNRLRS